MGNRVSFSTFVDQETASTSIDEPDRLGASNFTYAEAVRSQKLPDWIAAHVRAFAYFGGIARQTVSDNLKAGITKACFHEPTVNRTPAFAGAALRRSGAALRHRHRSSAPLQAARQGQKPALAKAGVEVGVQVVGRWILARLRHRRFSRWPSSMPQSAASSMS
jgi:transposase